MSRLYNVMKQNVKDKIKKIQYERRVNKMFDNVPKRRKTDKQ